MPYVAGPTHGKNDFGRKMLEEISRLEKRSGIKLETAQKILLAETGTIEQVLSILANSRVVVSVLKQEETKGVIIRESTLCNDSGRTLIRARSKIVLKNLPQCVARQIRAGKHGIGTIIQNARLETYRRIIEIGWDPNSRLAFRTYQIIHQGKVAFEIREEILSEVKSEPNSRGSP